MYIFAGNSSKMKHQSREKSFEGEDTILKSDKEQKHTRKVSNQKVATISQNYNEKTMLLSSDDE